jgi:hypothetical protein
MAAIYTTTHMGQTASRRSARHLEQIYTHAIWVKGNKNGVWCCEAYTSRPDLAQARASEFRRCSWVAEVAIVPVTCEFKTVKPKPDVTYPGEHFEVEGVQFAPDRQYGRAGNYQGWVILLTCTGRVFRCVATDAARTWNVRIYVGNGGLESRVRAMKAEIDKRRLAEIREECERPMPPGC